MDMNELKKYQSRNNIRMDELLDVANYYISLIVPNQPSERVSNKLTERNVRYYINQGLVDRPIGKQGLAALYAYKHLLQLIALKKLQSSYLPVKKISALIKEKTNAELFAIAVEQPVEKDKQSENTALSFLNSISSPPSASDREANHLHAPPMPSVEKTDLRNSSPNQFQSLGISWDRYELDEGIELHIRSDQKKKSLKSKIKKALHAFLDSL